MGGDERAAVHALLAAVADRPAALAALETLLLALGREEAAGIVGRLIRGANRFGWDGSDKPVKGQ